MTVKLQIKIIRYAYKRTLSLRKYVTTQGAVDVKQTSEEKVKLTPWNVILTSEEDVNLTPGCHITLWRN